MYFSHNGKTLEFDSQENFDSFLKDENDKYLVSLGISVPTATAILEDSKDEEVTNEADKDANVNTDVDANISKDESTDLGTELSLVEQLKLLDDKNLNDKLWSMDEVELKNLYKTFKDDEFAGNKNKLIKELIRLIKA